MSRMDQAVCDGISDGGFPNEFISSIDGEIRMVAGRMALDFKEVHRSLDNEF